MAARTRLGPYVHVRFQDQWEDRRANIVGQTSVAVPVHCRICKRRREPGSLVMIWSGKGYVGVCCLSFHVRGFGGCPLCDRLRMEGPKCRHCDGTGYGAQEV